MKTFDLNRDLIDDVNEKCWR